MKKKTILGLICCLAVLLAVGCGKEEKDKTSDKSDKELYIEVIDNKQNYITEDNKEKSVNDYLTDENITDGYSVEYALIDLDNDNKDEMIVLFGANDGYYLILKNEDGKIYGFERDYRSMVTIKEDGTMLATNSASSSEIYKVSFDKNKMENISLAVQDGNTYKLDGKTATKKEVEKYYDEFNAKKDVEFTEYKK